MCLAEGLKHLIQALHVLLTQRCIDKAGIKAVARQCIRVLGAQAQRGKGLGEVFIFKKFKAQR